jgi:hypothetical protein
MTVPVDHPFGEPETFAIRVPGGVAELHAHGLTVTRLRGFVPVDAVPHDTDEYRARARSLGYPDDAAGLLRMSREHELFHSVVAAWFDLPMSPTMRGIALREAGIGPWFLGWREEEALVLAAQKFARLVDADIMKVLSRAMRGTSGD